MTHPAPAPPRRLWMFKSIRVRLTAWYALILGVFLIVFAAASYALLVRAVAQRTDESLQETARAFAAAWVAERADGGRRVLSPSTAIRRFGAGDLEIVVFDRSRVVAAIPPNEEWVEERGDLTPRPDLAAAIGSIATANGTFTTMAGPTGARRVFAIPLQLGDHRQIVTVAQGLNDRDAMLRAARAIYLVAIPALLTLALIGGYVLAGRALAPVGKMAAQAREIGAATLSQRLRVPNAYDELGQLANVFNGLLDRLDRAFAQQRQFVADASHELRTPVAIVRGEAEVALAKDVRPEEEYRETLEIIHDEGRRMSRLVEDLFLLARADSGQLAPESTELYLDEVVGDSVRSLRTLAAARDISIEYETDGEMPLRGDEALLRRLVVNLVENAIKYGRAARPVKVQAHRGSADEYVVSVLNEGVPISPADQHRVFDRFFRTSDGAPEVATTEGDSGGGAGLGLAIARWIAEAHGGKLELTRSDSEGTEFRAILPSP